MQYKQDYHPLIAVADVSDVHTPCHFVACVDRRMVRGDISIGVVLPLVIFSSQSFTFLAPKGSLRPEYLARPFELSVGSDFYLLLLLYCSSPSSA